MKKILLIAFSFLLACSVAQSSDTLTIVHFNDTHSNLSPGGPRDENLKAHWGGIARMATFIGMAKLENPEAIVLHAGDFSIGDFFYNAFFGVPELSMYSAMGLDALTLGNHEFDLTPHTLLTVLDSSGLSYPLLSANMVVLDTSLGRLNNHIKPYTVKQVGDYKVGIFGLTTPEANLLSQPLPYVFIDTALAVRAVTIITELKTTEQCDFVILLSHLGLHYDKIIAENIPGIDVIVGGHDHFRLDQPVKVSNPFGKEVPIVQAEAQFKYGGKLDLYIDNDTISGMKYNLTKLDENIPEEPNIKSYVDLLIGVIEANFGPVYSEPIGRLKNDHDLTESVTKDSANLFTEVGNIVSRAFQWKTGTEIAIEVGGSTAQPLYKGEVVGSDVYRAISYGFNTDNYHGFRLCTFKTTGANLFMGIEMGLAQLDVIDDYLVQSVGLQYTYDMSKPPYSRCTGATVNGEPIDPERLYSVTSNEFLAKMMQTLGMPLVDLNIMSGVSEYQVVVDYITDVDDKETGIQKLNVHPLPSNGSNVMLSGNIEEMG